MQLKKCLYFFSLFIFVCFINYSCYAKKSTKPVLNITLVDSAIYSSKIVSALIYNVGKKHFGYVAGEKKTADIYNINEQGKLNLIEQYKITNKSGGIRALTKLKYKNSDLIILGNKANNALEIYKIKDNGKLNKINATYDTDSTFIDETVTIKDIKIKNRTFIYAGGLDKGLSCFELKDNGKLHHIQSIQDNDSLFLHGIIGMSSIVIGKKRFLITGAFFDGGISCFQVMENGHLKNVSNVKDDKILFLNGTYPVNTIQLGNENFILVGHRHTIHYSTKNAEKKYHGDGINVFKIDKEGQITLQSLIKDNNELKLKGSTRIEILKTNKKNALVFIGTRDDKGIQICSLKSDGILRPIKSINLGFSIYNGMTLKKINDNWFLLVGAYDKNIVETYYIKYN